MKKFIILLLIAAQVYGQQAEFGGSENGLIYSNATVNKLKFIVDSLNIKFRVCELNRQYLSKQQARAHYAGLDTGNVKDAVKDMQANMPYDDFMNKYGLAKGDKDLLIVKYRYKNYDEKDVIELSSMPGGHEHELTFDTLLSGLEKQVKDKWLFRYYEKSEYSNESVTGFYFTEEFATAPLPEKYARMIQYSDCMVDTNSRVFLEQARNSGYYYESKQGKKVKAFLRYVHKRTGSPGEFDEGNCTWETYWKQRQAWDSLKISRIDSLKASDEKKFCTLLDEAIGEALTKGGHDGELEEYAGIYSSRIDELALKRSRRVVGRCSMDSSPRLHAMNIAVLSAETASWEVFLRAHLDIMNDRFARISDGSYAWGRRQTYIKELEVLDIDVHDLLLGISLRVENPSMNHYYGDIGRLGRALAETKDAGKIETEMLSMISDSTLDDFNRVLIYYLYRNYNHYLQSEEVKKANMEKLEAAVGHMPAYLSTKLLADK